MVITFNRSFFDGYERLINIKIQNNIYFRKHKSAKILQTREKFLCVTATLMGDTFCQEWIHGM